MLCTIRLTNTTTSNLNHERLKTIQESREVIYNT